MRHDKDLKTARYEQAAAKFYGFDANIGYQINDVYHVALFGDYIRGKLTNLPDKRAEPMRMATVLSSNSQTVIRQDCHQNALA